MTDIREQIAASIAAKQAVLADATLLSQLESLAARCLASLRNGGKIIFAGNGGELRRLAASLGGVHLATTLRPRAAPITRAGYEQLLHERHRQ